jgi:hypothetical protein
MVLSVLSHQLAAFPHDPPSGPQFATGINCPFLVDLTVSFHTTKKQLCLLKSQALASVEYNLHGKKDEVLKIWFRKPSQLLI